MSTINLTEDTINCISTNIVKETTSNLDVCTIEVPFDFSITIGDELNLYDKDSTLLFKGLIQNIKIGGRKEIIAYDYGIQLMDINVNDIYNNEAPEDIIESIVTNNTDLTYVSTITTGTPITSFVVKDKRGWDVVNELAELLNASIRVDKNKNFYLELIEEDTSTETITDVNAVIDGDWDQDADQLVNKIIIIGDKQLFEKTESFNGTGAEDTFTLTEFPIDVNVTVGGVEQVGYVEGVTASADYRVDKGTKDVIFNSGSIPGSGTNNVVIRYTFSIDIKLTSQDNDSIVLYGGPNLIPKEKKIVKPYITSFQEAYKFANFYLEIYAQPLLTATWIINDYTKFEDFVPNQKILATDSIRDITDIFIIKKVEREFPGQLKVEIGWQEDDILDWGKEVQYRIKQLEEIDDNSTVLHEYDSIENDIGIEVQSEVSRELERTLPDDYIFFFSPIEGLIGWWKGNNALIDSSGEVNTLSWTGTPAYGTGKQFDNIFDFDTSNYVSHSETLSSINTVSFWMELDANNTDLIDLTSSAKISINGSNTITTSGLSNTIIYVNNSISSSAGLSTYYNILITFDDIDVDTFKIGDGTNGRIGDVRLYNSTISTDGRTSIYNSGLGLTSNSNINEVAGGEDRVFGSEISGLSSFWKLNGDDIDYSENGNDGTWVGTETYDIGKQFDLIGDFDGSSYIDITDAASYLDENEIFSISMWVKTIDYNNFQTFISNTTGPTSTFALDLDPPTLAAGFITGTVNWKSGTLSDNNWHHYIITHQGNSTSFYIDNVVQTGTTRPFIDSNVAANIGADSDGASITESKIGDVRVYNRVLSTNERTRLYNSGLGIKDNSINELSDGTLGDSYILSDANIYNRHPDSELSDLSALYRFEDQNATDEIGGNDGVETDITYTTGKTGTYASTYNGSTSKIVADTDITEYPFTMMCWVNTNSISSTSTTLSLNDESTTNVFYRLYRNVDKIAMSASNTTDDSTDSITSISINTWYHIAVRFKSATERFLYLDGEKESYDTTNVTFNTNVDKLLMGIKENSTGSDFWDGEIDDVVVIERDCTSDEIKARYNSGTGRNNRNQSWDDIT